jgi:hypothetical protein
MGDAGILLIGLRAVFPVLNLTTEYDSLPRVLAVPAARGWSHLRTRYPGSLLMYQGHVKCGGVGGVAAIWQRVRREKL